MPNNTVPAAGEAMPKITRRTILGGVACMTMPAAVASAQCEPLQRSIDDFFAQASPAERARYYASALAEALAEMHPDSSWRSHINHDHRFALVVGDRRPVFIVRQEA